MIEYKWLVLPNISTTQRFRKSKELFSFLVFSCSLAKHFMYKVELNFVKFYNYSHPVNWTCSLRLFKMFFGPSEHSQSKSVATAGSFPLLNEHVPVIYPRLLKYAVVVNFLTHTGNLTEPCQLTSVFPFLFVFCPLLVPGCSVIFLMLVFPLPWWKSDFGIFWNFSVPSFHCCYLSGWLTSWWE